MFCAHINGLYEQSCNDHSLNTARYASEALDCVGLTDTGYLAGLLHDVGKYSEEFDSYIHAANSGERVQKGSVIHSFAGARCVMERWHHKYNESISSRGWESITAEIIATAVGSHHGLFDEYDCEGNSGLDYRMNKQPEYDKKAVESFFSECISEEKLGELFEKAKQEIKGISGNCQSLAQSNEEIMFYIGLVQRLINSAVMDGDRKDTAEFMSSGKISYINSNKNERNSMWEAALENTVAMIKGFPASSDLDKARSEMSDYCEKFASNNEGIYRLSLPTGAGKTLSSLRYALKHALVYDKKRIIFAVPLLSVIDQNAEVIRKAVNNDNVILEHHSNVVKEELHDGHQIGKKESEELQRRELLIETWDAPIIITTLVQLLNTMFDGRTSSIRRFRALCNSVIIIDEVQSVPDKMISLFNLTLNFLSRICGATIILCSATQPALELAEHSLNVSKESFIPQESIRKYEALFKRNTAKYEGELSINEIGILAETYREKYGSVLVICNTKKEAGALFNQLKHNGSCYHLSTAMCMSHRREAVKRMRNNLNHHEPIICVSTQLIEAGVDISFGAVIRINAGMDSIIQAAGRCNRNSEKTSDAPVAIVSLVGENLSKLKEIKRAQDSTNELIYEYIKNPMEFDNDLFSEKAIIAYYKNYFRQINNIVGLTDYSVDGCTLFDYLSENRNNALDCSQTMRQAFKTAGNLFKVFDNDQISVIVPYGEGKTIISRLLSSSCKENLFMMKKLLKSANDYTVNIFNYQFEKLKSVGAVYNDEENTFTILRSEYYDEYTGIVDCV